MYFNLYDRPSSVNYTYKARYANYYSLFLARHNYCLIALYKKNRKIIYFTKKELNAIYRYRD
jgi:hypothetical protein